MKPYISFIVPTYNSSKTLQQTISSITEQNIDLNIYEVVFIDGVSTDNTLNIIKEYNNKNVKVVCEPDEGIYDAMNKGVDISTGEYLWFLNSDDFLIPDILNSIIDKLKNNNPDYLYANALLVTEDNGKAYGISKGVPIHQYPEYIQKGLPFCHQASIIRTDIFKKVGGYVQKYKYCSEYDLFLKIYKLGYIGIYLNENVVNYRDGGASHGYHVFIEQEKIMKANGLNPFKSKYNTTTSVIKLFVRLNLPQNFVKLLMKFKKNRFDLY